MKRVTKLTLMKALHFAVNICGFAFVYFVFYRLHYAKSIHLRGDFLLCSIFGVLYVLYSRVLDSYDLAYAPEAENIISQSLTAMFTDVVLYFGISLYYAWMVNPIPMLQLLLAQIIWNVLWTYTAVHFFYRWFPNRKTALIYGSGGEMKLSRMMKTYAFRKGFTVEKVLKNPTDVDEVLKSIEGMDIVILSEVQPHIRSAVVSHCSKSDISAYVFPSIEDIQLLGSKSVKTFNDMTLGFHKPMPNREYLFVKRAFDITVSALMLLILSPLMGVIAILIKRCDGGPVFYRQKRLTMNGMEFDIIKFRSMIVDAEKDGVARLTSKNDSRITPIGKVIRKLRLDELPQLINILKGDMSLIGPRPERPDIAAMYETETPDFSLRLQVKAGLTGYAQVYGKYNTPPLEKLQMDLIYINKMSIIEDLRILSMTAKVVFLSRSTEGFEPDEEENKPDSILL